MCNQSDNNNNNNNKTSPSNADQISPVSEFIDLTDKTLDQAYRNASRMYRDYSDSWTDSVDDTLATTLPTFFREHADNFFQNSRLAPPIDDTDDRGWHRGHWRRFRNRGGNFSSDSFQIGGDSVDNNGVAAATTPSQFIALDPSKPKNLWAFPVPNDRQYEKCKELEGTSLWTRDGVWRCLFPSSASEQSRLNQALDNSKHADFSAQVANSKAGGETPDIGAIREAQVFPDVSIYLNWKTAIRKAIQAKRAQERAEWQKQFDSRFQNRGYGENQGQLTQAPSQSSETPQQQQQQQQQPKFISEEEAHAQNKKVVSSAYSSSTFTKEDGSLETRKVVEKWYDDGTTSVTERVSNSANHNDDTRSSSSSSGWFWK